MQIKKLLVLPLIGFAGLMLSGCTDSTDTEASAVEDQQKLFVNNQPAPVFDWSLERHLLIQLYKARNDAVNTYTKVRNFNGQVIFECNSIGFPIPANTQLTNPDKIADSLYQGGFAILPQPEPNGLYTSPSTAGTFVFCLNDDGTVSPSYFEADVEAHTKELKIKTSK